MKYHILQVTVLRYPEIVGGVDTMVYNLTEKLKEHVKVSVLVPGTWEQKALSVSHHEEVIVYSILLRLPVYQSNPFKNLLAWLLECPKTVWELRKIIKQNQIDLIHCHLAMSHYLYFIVLKYLIGTPYIVTLHGSDVVHYDEQPGWYRFIVRQLLKYSSHTNAVSNWLAQLAHAKFELQKSVTTVYNGLDLPALEKDIACVQNRRFPFRYFMMVGSFDPYKGHLTAIEAWEYVVNTHPDLHLVIAGEGILQPDYEKLIAKIGCQERVHLIGQISHSEVIELLKFSEGLIFPSVNEGLGYVLLEAGAVGVPVICTDIPTFLEVINNQKNGIIVKLGDAISIANAVKIIQDFPEYASNLSMQLKEKIYCEFSANRMTENYMAIYESILRKD